jgi:hypothetical protein
MEYPSTRNENHTEKVLSQQHRKRKQKNKCQHTSFLDSILQGMEEKIPVIKHTETFLESREELMKLREKAWQMSVRRQLRKQSQHQAQIDADRAAHQAESRKMKHSIVEKAERKILAASYPSVDAVKTDVASVLSQQSCHTVPTDFENGPVQQHIKVFPKAKNRREAFRAYTAKHLLRLKAGLILKHHLGHVNKDPTFDQWGRPIRTKLASFDNKNPYLIKIIKKLIRSKMGFRYKYETRAEEFLTNFPFVEFQTYQKFPVTRMTKHDRMKHYTRLKKLYLGQRLFKMMTP